MRIRHESFTRKLMFILLYTGIFILLAISLDNVFLKENRSFVWHMDGMAQHVIALKYIRTYIINFFQTGNFPMMDFSIGQGFDVIGTLNYYGFGDPLTLITVLFPDNALERMYEVFIFAHIYIAGLGFALFCKVSGKNKIECVLPGAILYAFCNFAILGGMRHPLFLNGLMYLPFLLAGVEKIIKDKKTYLLAIAVGFAFASNYYFMYMNTISAAIYFFIRQVDCDKREKIKLFFINSGKIVLSYLWGIGLSGIILFPSIYAFVTNARGETSGFQPGILYDKKYYDTLFSTFFVSVRVTNRWSMPGIGILGVIALIIILVRWKKEERKFILWFVVCVAMVSIPWAGKIMNGFTYVTNRFSYVIAFIIALMVVYAISDLKEFNRVQWIIYTIFILASGIYCYFMSKQVRFPKIYFTALGFIIAAYILCIIYYLIRNFKYGYMICYCFTAIAVINLSYNFITIFSSQYCNYCNDFIPKGTVISKIEDESTNLFKDIKDESFYRTTRDRDLKNRSLYNGVNGMTYYYSVVPDNIKELFNSACLANFNKPFMLLSTENRTGLQALASVKYFAAKSSEYVPYGYEKIKENTTNGKSTYLYKNKYSLPLGYTYDSYLTKEQYYQLKPEQREQALLSAAVTETGVPGFQNGEKNIEKVLTEKPKIRTNKKVSVSEDKIVAKKNGKITLSFRGKKNCETYLVLKGGIVYDASGDATPAKVKSKYGKGKIRIRGTNIKDYYYREACIVNLGYAKKSQKKCSIQFFNNRIYHYDDMYIAYVPIKSYTNKIRKLKMDATTKEQINNNHISAEIHCSKKEILQLSIPYNIGFTAYVDGKKARLFSSGIGYMGLGLEKGKHKIELVYKSPGFTLGLITTSISLIILLFYLTHSAFYVIIPWYAAQRGYKHCPGSHRSWRVMSNRRCP